MGFFRHNTYFECFIGCCDGHKFLLGTFIRLSSESWVPISKPVRMIFSGQLSVSARYLGFSCLSGHPENIITAICPTV